jgi:hypothetical protein
MEEKLLEGLIEARNALFFIPPKQDWKAWDHFVLEIQKGSNDSQELAIVYKPTLTSNAYRLHQQYGRKTYRLLWGILLQLS